MRRYVGRKAHTASGPPMGALRRLNERELLALETAASRWRKDALGRPTLWKSDSIAALRRISSGSGKSPPLCAIANRIRLLLLHNGIRLAGIRLPGRRNPLQTRFLEGAWRQGALKPTTLATFATAAGKGDRITTMACR
jgi:hypothetical protein